MRRRIPGKNEKWLLLLKLRLNGADTRNVYKRLVPQIAQIRGGFKFAAGNSMPL